MGAAEQQAELRKRRAQIDARLAALDARAAADRRKADTRRKIVIGAGVLALAARNPDFALWLSLQLPEVLSERDWAQVGNLRQPSPLP